MTLDDVIESYIASDEVWRAHIDRLDLAYVRATGEDIAVAIREGYVIEAAFQPGDGTRYDLVVVPLGYDKIQFARPRVKEGREWETIALDGFNTARKDGTAILVVWNEHGAYPFDLASPAAWPYVAEKLANGNSASGITLSLLLIAAHEAASEWAVV